jgi:hypothetical protein
MFSAMAAIVTVILLLLLADLRCAHGYTCTSCANDGTLLQRTPCICSNCSFPFVPPDCSHRADYYYPIELQFDMSTSWRDFYSDSTAKAVRTYLGFSAAATKSFAYSRLLNRTTGCGADGSAACWVAIFTAPGSVLQPLLLTPYRSTANKPAWYITNKVQNITLVSRSPSPSFFDKWLGTDYALFISIGSIVTFPTLALGYLMGFFIMITIVFIAEKIMFQNTDRVVEEAILELVTGAKLEQDGAPRDDGDLEKGAVTGGSRDDSKSEGDDAVRGLSGRQSAYARTGGSDNDGEDTLDRTAASQ